LGARCWHSWALYARTTFRNYNTPESRYSNLGLRVVREEARSTA
jgi:formylglycine-generating enzyme required for sulfatase activity